MGFMFSFARYTFTSLLCFALGLVLGRTERGEIHNSALQVPSDGLEASRKAVPSSPAVQESSTSTAASDPFAAGAPANSVTEASSPPPSQNEVFCEEMQRLYAKGRGDEAVARFALMTVDHRLALLNLMEPNYRRGWDPEFVARLIMGLPDDVRQKNEQLLGRLLRDWSDMEADGALRFVESLPPENVTPALLYTLAYGLSSLPVERVVAFAQRLNEKQRDSLTASLALVLDHPGRRQNAEQMIAQIQPEGSSSGESAYYLGKQIATLSPEEVEQSLATEPDAKARQQLIAGYAIELMNGDRPLAMQWAAQIDDPERRQARLELQMHIWAESAREDAIAWLLGEGRTMLSPENQHRFRRELGLEVRR